MSKQFITVRELTAVFNENIGQVPFELAVRLTFNAVTFKPDFCFDRIDIFSQKWKIFSKRTNKDLDRGKHEEIDSFESYLLLVRSDIYKQWSKRKRKRKANI